MTVSRREARVFEAAADALLGTEEHGFLGPLTAAELRIAERFPEAVERLSDRKLAGDLRRFLRLLGNPVVCSALFANPTPFRALPRPLAERALRRMATHPLAGVRAGYQAVRRMAGYLAVTTEDGEANPLWDAIGYPGPDGPAPDEPRPLRPIEFTAAGEWHADVVVVGSGAGGGVAAAVLAEAGLDVVVLEKGQYLAERDFTHREGPAHRDLYQDGTLGSTDDLGIALAAGSCLGGGTVINYCTSFATPRDVREEWDRVAGWSDVFTGEDFDTATKTVLARIDVTEGESRPSRRDELMDAGLRAIGLGTDVIPRNVSGCPQDAQCGACVMGCRRGAKRSGTVTWLADAAAAGARFVVGADVVRVVTNGRRAVGVEAIVAGRPLTVRAGRAVILAAGALNTPGILQRSGLGGRAVGRNLRLHPVTAVWGRFAEPVRPWEGTAQARYADRFADLDGTGYGVRFETAPIHPALPAAFFAWESPSGFRERLSQLPFLSPVGILLRDRDAGRARIRGDGRPYWRYRPSSYDAAHVRRGVRLAAEVLAAAGAVEILASTSIPLSWGARTGEPLTDFLDRVDGVGYGPNRTMYVSFHQMGSARMGSAPRRSVVNEENQVHGVRGLFVMDASCFPTASGVNPMVTIEAIAHRGASLLASRLT